MNARVFVSYSWDNEQHQAWVRELCARLVTDGIQVRLDQWYVRPGDSFLKFMEDEIRLADVVIVVCTPAYAMKANARRGGVGFEGQIISNAIFRGIAKKCIPVIVSGTIESGPTCAVPTFLEGIVAIFFSEVDDEEVSYEELLRSILGKPRFVAPPLGELPKLLSDAELLWGSRGGQRVAAELDYSSPLVLDFSTVANAIDAIQALGNPLIWRDFKDSKPEGLWMKSESNVLTSTLYAIWAPMVDFELERVSWERRFAGFDWRAKLQALLMAAIANAYQDDDTLSCIQPGLPYSPRVAGWRIKREHEPAKFWWQGLSEDRWKRAVQEFLTKDAQYGVPRRMSGAEFRVYYRDLFSSNDEAAQQALGLAANGLFRFRTIDRPVYWRLLTCQVLMYHGLLRTRSASLSCPRTADDLIALCRPIDDLAFPLGAASPDAEQVELMATTVRVAQDYIRELVAPRLLRRLRI